jgi:DNA-binding NarL/FixJ family response regulator
MPDMEGLIVITKLKALKPEIKTLLLTGHGDDKLKEATQALNSFYSEKEDMGSFWGVFRKILNKLESSMAAAGMAEGGDIDDAMLIEKSEKKK